MHMDEPAASFPVLAAMESDGECAFTAPVLGDITAVREYDHVRVSGRVGTQVSLVCSRCLAPYVTDIASSFTIFFRKETSRDTVEEEEIELNEQDLVSATYSGDEIDLTHEIGEQVAMEVPLKPLCGEGCKGLCPVCGTDLNQAACSCQREQVSLKFSALKDFKVSR